jgi:hypothetical protein
MNGKLLGGVFWASALLSVVFAFAIVIGQIKMMPVSMHLPMIILMVFGAMAIYLGFALGYGSG